MIKTIAFWLAVLIGLPVAAAAHSGGVDKYGGHTDGNTGNYHFHQDAQGRKLAEPMEGADPDKNGGNVRMQGRPKYADEDTSSEKAAPKKRVSRAEKKEKAEAAVELKEKKAKKEKAEKKEKASASDDKKGSKPKSVKKAKKKS